MKRILILILVLLIAVSLASCGGTGAKKSETSPEKTEAITEAVTEAITEEPPTEPPKKPSAKKIVKGKKIKKEEYNLTINNIELTYQVNPPDTSSYYRCYKAKKGKVFIHIDGKYYNKSKKDVCIEDLPFAIANFNHGYEYEGFAIVDNSDGDAFEWVDSYVICEPLESCHYHCLIECPKKIATSKAPLFITMQLDDEKYRYTLRK